MGPHRRNEPFSDRVHTHTYTIRLCKYTASSWILNEGERKHCLIAQTHVYVCKYAHDYTLNRHREPTNATPVCIHTQLDYAHMQPVHGSPVWKNHSRIHVHAYTIKPTNAAQPPAPQSSATSPSLPAHPTHVLILPKKFFRLIRAVWIRGCRHCVHSGS
jgi:hypothetical protein